MSSEEDTAYWCPDCEVALIESRDSVYECPTCEGEWRLRKVYTSKGTTRWWMTWQDIADTEDEPKAVRA